VFLLEPDRTDYDLRWRMFGIPIRVHPMFWVLSAILGWGTLQAGFQFLLVWIGCVFVSILIHELGHVFMGRLFGAEGHIVLYSFGGLAIGSNSLSSRGQRILVSFAGPLAGFLFLGVLALALAAFAPGQLEMVVDLLRLLFGYPPLQKEPPPPLSPLVQHAIWYLFEINLFWGLLNLLPVWPLDGGQISRDFFTGISRENGVRISLGISLVVSGVLAVQALSVHLDHPLIPFLWWLGGIYMAIMFGLLAFQSFQLLQISQQRPWREDWPNRWDRG
jgi:stage IV sporulation protein FB